MTSDLCPTSECLFPSPLSCEQAPTGVAYLFLHMHAGPGDRNICCLVKYIARLPQVRPDRLPGRTSVGSLKQHIVHEFHVLVGPTAAHSPSPMQVLSTLAELTTTWLHVPAAANPEETSNLACTRWQRQFGCRSSTDTTYTGSQLTLLDPRWRWNSSGSYLFELRPVPRGMQLISTIPWMV